MSHRVLKGYLGSGLTAIGVVLSASVFVAACGQNAHVTRPNGTGSAVKPADAVVLSEDPGSKAKSEKEVLILVKEGEEQDQDLSENPSEISKSGSPETSTSTSSQISTEKNTSQESTSVTRIEKETGQGTQGVHGVTGATGEQGLAAAPTVIEGPQGPQGAPGRDGINACTVERRSVVFVAGLPEAPASYAGKKDAMKHAFDDFAKNAVLPYVSTRAHQIAVLPLGGSNRVEKTSGERYVENAMTLMSFKITLPPSEGTMIRRADLLLSVKKLNADSRHDTEVLCLVDERICSGKLFDTKGWLSNINKSYFTPDTYTGPVNNSFSDLLTDEINRKYIGRTIWENEQLTLPLSAIISGSKIEGQVKDLLYSGSTSEMNPVERTLNVVVADDTYVKSAKLVLEFDEDTCVTGKRY